MSKGLKPGYLYILNDVDQRTGVSSPYYKIGITFEAKTVEERIKEHQTGNPRDIVCVFALKTEAPFLVEQSLHRLHSSDRIRLEWFEFKEEKELENLIDEAKKLDATFSPKIKAIRKNAVNDSNGKMAVLSTKELADATLHHSELKQLLLQLLECTLKKDIITELFKEITADNGQGIDGIVEVSVSGQGDPTFNVPEFKKSSPANLKLWDSFQKTSRKDEFKLIGNPTPAKHQSKLHQEKQTQVAKAKAVKPEATAVQDSGISRTQDLEKTHAEYIELLDLEGELKAKIEEKELLLQILIGENDGIEDIANWVRSETSTFDKTAFKNAHHDLFTDLTYYKTAKATVSYKVAKSRNYII